AYAGVASTAKKTTLDMNSAKTVSGAFASDCGACSAAVSECARLSSRRVDCVVTEDGTCSEVVATTLFTNGFLYNAIYRCKSDAPTTAAAQVQLKPPGGLHYELLSLASFEFASDVFPKRLPYPRYPVRHYHGRTSQAHNAVDIWTDRKH